MATHTHAYARTQTRTRHMRQQPVQSSEWKIEVSICARKFDTFRNGFPYFHFKLYIRAIQGGNLTQKQTHEFFHFFCSFCFRGCQPTFGSSAVLHDATIHAEQMHSYLGAGYK